MEHTVTKKREIKRIVLAFLAIFIVAIIIALHPLASTEEAHATKAATEEVYDHSSESSSPLTDGKLKLVTGLVDDVMPKLKESAEIKVVTTFNRFCVGQKMYEWFDPDDVSKGNIYRYGNEGIISGHDYGAKTTAIWMENLIEPSPGARKANGAALCSKGSDDTESSWRTFTGAFPVYATYIGRGYNRETKTSQYHEIICRKVNGKYYSGMLSRYMKQGGAGWKSDNEQKFKMDPGCEKLSTHILDMTEDDVRTIQEVYADLWGCIEMWTDSSMTSVRCLNWDEYGYYFKWQAGGATGYDFAYVGNYGNTPPYIKATFKETYDRYVYEDSVNNQLSGFHNGNQYLPPWDEGWSYNNVDGYFNYVRDLNVRCGNYLDMKDENVEGSYPVTMFSRNKTRVTAKKRWFLVTEEQKWDYPLSEDNPVTNCSGLLKRIEWLRNHPNGADYIYRGDESAPANPTTQAEIDAIEKQRKDTVEDLVGDAKAKGYEGIILSILQNTCNNMVDAATGQNAYTQLKLKLQEYIKYPGVSQEDIDTATAAIEKIEKAEAAGTFMVATGSESEPDGKVYECLDVDGLEQILDEYVPPSAIIEEEENLKDLKYNCYSNAGPLGWILCPIIDGLKQFIIQQYGQWVAPALQIDPVLFGSKTDEYNQTYQAWAIFRDIGNFLFILLFLVVIFSQISGVGIDNYSIKKMLPKIIIAVVLINLSYILCQVAVDLCNIVGNQIGKFIQRITNVVKHPSVLETTEGITIRATDRGSWGDVDSWGSSFKQNWLGNSMLIIAVAGLGIGAFLYKGLAVIVPVLMMMLSCAISILGLIIILGLRQAAAVVLVVASPLALACYMLPNTRKIFDRWFAAFKGLLVAFPICSMVVYGSDLAATILVWAGGKGNTWVIISAAVISIAPIFIIPKVIRKSVAGISGILTGATNKVKGRATSKAREKLNNTRIGDRQRYNDNMRAQMRKGQVGAYNAKRGAATLRHKKYQDPSKLRLARSKRTYNAALAAVNAENSSQQDAYENQFSNQDDMKIMSDIGASIQKGGKMNVNMVVAGLNRMTNDGNAIAMLRSIAQTNEYKEMLKNDPQANQRIAEAMMGRRGNIIAQSMGKLMAKGESVNDMFDNGSLRDKVQGAGTSVMASQSKDAFNMEGAEKLFSDDQIRAGLAAGYGGDTDRAFGRMLQRIQTNPDGSANEEGDKRMDKIVGEMTGEQVSKMSEVGLAAVGGADRVIRTNERAINQLNSEDGKNFRNNMNVNVGKALHIKDIGKADPTKATPADDSSTGGDGGTDGGGDPAPVDVDIPH